ncbi:MAG: hypothetical protein LCH20_03970 [Proteobacteria bacterium]|nr:hypothetical protein [Pseudomonadota bacterium]
MVSSVAFVRQFVMKDAYSFDIDMHSATRTYDQVFVAYMRTFRDLGLNAIPLSADPGEIGGDLSHEFHVVADTGESTLYYDKKFDLLGDTLANDIKQLKSLYAATEEKHNPDTCPLKESELSVRKGIEVGHIFNFSDKYSAPMAATVNDANGKIIPIQMGSYGIGISRLVAAIIEVSHDEKGIIWPMQVAPFKVSIINLNTKDEKCNSICDALYNKLLSHSVDVVYDDTTDSVGTKLATHDLIGSPWQIIVGPKKAATEMVELKHRESSVVQDLNAESAVTEVLNSLHVK